MRARCVQIVFLFIEIKLWSLKENEKGGKIKMESQENLRTIGIGTKETTKLKPANVKIVKVEIVTVGEKGSNKVVCHAKHPDAELTIAISSVKYVNKQQKLVTTGLWVNLDDEKKIKKGSAFALFLSLLSCANVEALEGRDCLT